MTRALPFALPLLLAAPLFAQTEGATEMEPDVAEGGGSDEDAAPLPASDAPPPALDDDAAEGEGEPEGEAEGRLPADEKDGAPSTVRDGTLSMGGGAPSPYLDTRLSFSLSDDDFLRGPAESRPSSPFVDFSPRSNNQAFFDNLNQRDSSYATLGHLVMHRRQAGFLPGLDTEAALVVRIQLAADDQTGALRTVLGDDGSYLRVRWFFSGSTLDEKAPNIDVTMFPFNSDRFRLGYLYDLSWGGINIFPGTGIAAPGARVTLNLWDAYAFIGAKTARLLDETPGITTREAYWGGLAGAGWDIFQLVSVDVGTGVFHRGTNPNPGVTGEPVLGYGASGRVALHLGRGVPGSLDFRLYRVDPALSDMFTIAKKPREGLSFLGAVEYSHLQQTLQDPDNLASTVIQPANAAALTLRFGWDNLELGSDTIYRDLSYTLFTAPGFTTFQDFPDNVALTPEVIFALHASWLIEWLHLTPGVVVGLQMPGSVAGLDDRRLSQAGLEGAKTQVVVVRNVYDKDVLPCAEYEEDGGARTCVRPNVAEPIYAMRFALKWDLSTMLALVAETTFFVDNNETIPSKNSNSIDNRERAANVDFLPDHVPPGTTSPHNLRIAGGIFAQARF